MVKILLAPTVLAVALAVPALAATTTTNNTGPGSTMPGASSNQNQQGNQTPTPAIAQKLHDSLAQAGFTDIHVMARSFLVRAKDHDGNPVMMIINPDSMTAVTALGSSASKPTHNPDGSQAGSGSSGSAMDQKHL